jgi:enolase-phosphatase E1
MSRLTVYPEDDPATLELDTIEAGRIALALQAIPARFERWQASEPLLRDVSDAAVMQAYRADIAAGLKLYVYSSGSVEAQRLLFSHTSDGDMTPLFSGYFDTTIGSKLEARSYRHVADSLFLAAGEVVFISDHPGETKAAAAAGMHTVLMAREQGGDTAAPAARSFDDIVLKR